MIGMIFAGQKKKNNMEDQENKIQATEEKQTENCEGATNRSELDSEVTGETPQSENTDELQALKEKVEELQDKYLRQVAEFDNYRKRTLKEKAELILNGGEKVIQLLLPILDDFERTVKNMENTEDLATIKEGVTLVRQKLLKALSSQGLTPIETEGVLFDTDFHEAIALIPATKDSDKGKILDCVQTGYKLNEKVIRHAKVAVGQ